MQNLKRKAAEEPQRSNREIVKQKREANERREKEQEELNINVLKLFNYAQQMRQGK